MATQPDTAPETLKRTSRGLRGALAEELRAPPTTGGISDAAYSLLKFHGTYEQFDRDTATPRVPGEYAIFAGGDFEGAHLSFKLHERVPAEAVAATLDPPIAAWSKPRHPGEGFDDFCTRFGPAAARSMLPSQASRMENQMVSA